MAGFAASFGFLTALIARMDYHGSMPVASVIGLRHPGVLPPGPEARTRLVVRRPTQGSRFCQWFGCDRAFKNAASRSVRTNVTTVRRGHSKSPLPPTMKPKRLNFPLLRSRQHRSLCLTGAAIILIAVGVTHAATGNIDSSGNFSDVPPGGTDIIVNITTIPEYHAALLGSLGMLVILLRRRRA